MSDRNYTTIEVSGPNANAAAKFAMEAILKQTESDDWDGWCGCWIDDVIYGDDLFFDHDSGQGAVLIITEVSRQFPEATFHRYVDGSCGDGYQGLVRIQNGDVIDGRYSEILQGGGSVEFYTDLSRHFPDEAFIAFDEERLKQVRIHNGNVTDVKPGEVRKPRTDRIRVAMSPEQRERQRLLYGNGDSLLVTSHEPETPEDVEENRRLDETYRTLRQGK